MESGKNSNFLTEELPAAIKALSSSAITYKGDETNFHNLHKANPLKPLEVVNDSTPEILSINSYEYDEEEETSSSFLGASHPPEPIDIDLMQTLYVDIDDTNARSPNLEEKTVRVSGLKPELGTKTTILWDASQPPSGNVSPHSMINSYTNTKASESARTSLSDSSGLSDDSNYSNVTTNGNKPHKGNDPKWKAIMAIRARDGILGMSQFRLLRRLGCGDIGSVYLSELSGTRCFFAMKVMDKASLASRKKLARAQTERDILQMLDHPFLPTLYSHFETDRFLCLVMEYCPGGDLHSLRQRQPGKYFSEDVARFYAAEILLALEYLHMQGIIYRDLKPENVLIRADGHIMLSDFDLSLRCTVSPSLIHYSSKEPSGTFCAQPACIQPTCFLPKFFSKKKSKPLSTLPELMAEPTTARSMSFVGTHEYLAPEIIKGEGHGSAVDWWTFGVFIHEMLYGKTPFKGSGNRATMFNVVGQELRFPEFPGTSCASKDLIRGLLVKEPRGRLGVKRGATEIKQHPFFGGVNWALIRCTKPPGVPKVVDDGMKVKIDGVANGKRIVGADVVKSGGEYLDFEFF